MTGRGVNRYALFAEGDENSPAPNPTADQQTRNVSGTADDGVKKLPDPHENWCGVCNLKFATKAALQSHMKQTPNHQHYCNLCKRVFKGRNELQNHVDKSAGHDIYCNICLSAFKTEWGLKNHFQNNYGPRHEFACLTCLKGFNSAQEMQHHLQTSKKHTWCNTCHLQFLSQSERDKHWVMTQNHKHCLQPGCEFDAPTIKGLDEHHKKDHSQCEYCKCIFPSNNKLMAHRKHCYSCFQCPGCDERFPDKSMYTEHMKHCCFYCGECGFFTTHEGEFNIHMTKHLAPELECWACKAPMLTLSNIINHLESGRCPNLPDPTLLLLCLGHCWYSPLYMDVGFHVRIRTERNRLNKMWKRMKKGRIHPFVCRANGCHKAFSHLSSLVLHVESQVCDWDVDKLRLDWLEQEFNKTCM